MDYEEINDHMTEQQKSSLRAAVLQQMAGTTMTYDEINNCLSEQQKTSLMTAALQTMVEDASGVPQEYTNYDDVNNQLSEQQKSSLMAAALMYLKDNGGGGDCGEGIGFGEGTRVKGITSDVNITSNILPLDLSQATSAKQLFTDNSSQGFKHITISNADLSNITDCTRMFETCASLETVIFDNTTPSGWSPIAANMFYNCIALKRIVLSEGFSPTSCQYFAYNCRSLEELPTFDASKSTSINMMYKGVSPTGTAKVPVYNFSSATSITSVFGDFGSTYDPAVHGDISENIENILKSMLTLTSYTGTKRWSNIFSYTPSSSSYPNIYNIIVASPTYQLLLNAGWDALS